MAIGVLLLTTYRTTTPKNIFSLSPNFKILVEVRTSNVLVTWNCTTVSTAREYPGKFPSSTKLLRTREQPAETQSGNVKTRERGIPGNSRGIPGEYAAKINRTTSSIYKGDTYIVI